MPPELITRSLVRTLLLALSFSALACDRGSDQGQAEWWQGERERVEVSQQLELANLRLGMAASEDFQDLQSLASKNAAAARLLSELRVRHVGLERELGELEAGAEGFRAAVLKQRRQEALGASYATLRVGANREFQQVSVLAIDDAGVSIRHSDGTARLRFADLDAAQRVQFGLDEELAVAAYQREAVQVAAYERQLDAELASLEEKKARQESKVERDGLLASRKYQSLLASQRSSASVSPLSKPASSFGNGSYRYSSYRSYRPNYRYVYYQTPTPAYCRPMISIQTGRSVGVGCVTPLPSTHQRFSETTFNP
jgi:hypothetical protein